ncbi:type II toxin-antitoxin system prevent-host-death family antitoxin [Microbacterium telephonicum]|uniref:Antitoxin n=1 Tax=Microbacterium telephonicum TaxID=1714841 RepID=A0A498BYM3_9MICO|nr:type II toxin-antitoxin system prevent-host-death family antitoxin [Microbacterium telephonicum]RLK48944.1 prevent-host-death family protein [Microbacterium telephonicum]
MERVGIRELKAHLSAYVDAARNGERVVVTDRGVVVAQLVSADGESALSRLLDEGLAMPPSHARRDVPRPRRTRGTVSDLVGQQRE